MVVVDEQINVIDFEGFTFRDSDFLEGFNAQSNQLDPRYEDFLKGKGLIPVSTSVFIPVNLQNSGVMPFQLMPSIWKLVVAVDALCEKHHLEIRIQDLMNVYLARSCGKGRVSFRAMNADVALVTNLDSGDDRNWASRFLFINKASLGSGHCFIPDELADSFGEWKVVVDDESLARLLAFRTISPKERVWLKALGRVVTPQFDFVRAQEKKGESSNFEVKDQLGIITVMPMSKLETISSHGTHVSTRTRGKRKLSSVFDEVEALKKRAKVESVNTLHVPIDIPASPEKNEPVMESSVHVFALVANLSPEIIRKRRVLKSLSLYHSQKEFCEGSSERGESIAEVLVDFAAKGVLDVDYDLLVKKSVFASFQALHFSSAAARSHQRSELVESSLKEELAKQKTISLKIGETLDIEKESHVDTLVRLQKFEAELEISKSSLQSLDEKIIQLMNKITTQEEESKEIVVQYTLMARIGMLMEPVEERTKWSLQYEISAFKLRFPETDLKEWGISEENDDVI